jgi:serine/threonine-protein kinase
MMGAVGKESYCVLARLPDRGGCEVFLARAGDRLVVLERLPRALAVDPDVVRAFLEQARIGSQLGHPNVANIIDVGRLGSTYYVAAEYVEGELLRGVITHAKSQGRLQVPLRAVLTIIAGAVTGLHHAHTRKDGEGNALNVVHGHLTPSNVLISRDGVIKLLDFGMAETVTAAALPYRSPEQVREEPVDPRSDLFSLGSVLWELLTRAPLFKRGSSADTIAAIENDEAPAPSLQRLDVPPELDAIVLKLLAKAPERRYQHADDVLVDIEALATKLGFQISTTDLARMMRLWFNVRADLGKLTSDIVVAGLHLEADVTPGAPSPIDDLLDKVVSVDPAATPQSVIDERSVRATVIPVGEPEPPRETFEQIRDRILGARDGQGRAKAYTRPAGVATSSDASASSGGSFGMSPTAITDLIARVSQAAAVTAAATRRAIGGSVVDEGPKVVVDVEAIVKTVPNAAASDPREAPRAGTPTARPADEAPRAKSISITPALAMPRTQSTEWFERGEQEAREAHAQAARVHDHDDDHHDEPKAKATAQSTPEIEHHPRRRGWVIPALGAAVLVLGVVVIVKMAGRESSAKTYGTARPSIDAAQVAQVATLPNATIVPPVPAPEARPIDAAVAIAPPVDAAEVAAAPVVVPDAALAAPVVPPDAAPAAPPVVPVVPVASDATLKHPKPVVTSDTPKPDKPKVDKPKVEKPKPASEDKPASIDELVAAGNWAKANVACAKNTQFNAQILEECATAACQTKDTALATRWLHAIPRSQRDPMIAKCKDLGLEIAIP